MTNYLITGANSYLAKAITQYLSKDSQNKLLLVTRTDADFSNVQNRQSVVNLSGINLLEESSLSLLAAKCDSYFSGKVNIINCVGYYKGQEPFEKTTIAEAKRIFESNFSAVYNTAYALIPYLIKNGGGHFMGFSCKSVKYRYPEMAPFSASKAALECLTGSLANEYSKYGVIANSFSLSTLDTEYERNLKPHGDYANWIKLDALAKTLCEIIEGDFQLMNGNTIDLFNYSDSFFNKSYFERIRKV
jgi:NAD(P)-dependent dehydrogenase (short-subunit alcohol dehydrogenase family)